MNSNLYFIKKLFTNTKLKKIVNVYQPNYKNIKAQGFGDFIRGSIYLYHMSLILRLKFDIDLYNHSMSKYLKFSNKQYYYDENDIEGYLDRIDQSANIKLITEFIEKLNKHETDTIYVFNNLIPQFDIENPKYGIIQRARNIILPKIEPQEYVLTQLDQKLSSIGLQRNKYAIIHVRCGDFYMNIQKNIDSEKHKISEKHLQDIIKFIGSYCNNNKKYIIIGDSNLIKNKITNTYKFLYKFNSEIIHLGESINPSDKSILETLIDFQLMRYSNYIISFTAYGHGSGFSKYCAVMYDIPFKQILLKPELSYRV